MSLESSDGGVDCHSPGSSTSSSPRDSESSTANSTDMSSLSDDEDPCRLRFRNFSEFHHLLNNPPYILEGMADFSIFAHSARENSATGDACVSKLEAQSALRPYDDRFNLGQTLVKCDALTTDNPVE